MKVIFLDVDGVLHPASRREKFFERYCLECLGRVVAATGAEVVLSSNWRRSKTARNSLANELARYSIPMSSFTIDLGREGPNIRVQEILRWLECNPQCDSWIAIDDMNLMAHDLVNAKFRAVMERHFVLTDGRVGFTRKAEESAIRLLGHGTPDPKVLDLLQKGVLPLRPPTTKPADPAKKSAPRSRPLGRLFSQRRSAEVSAR